MEEFDYKNFLVENKLTVNSRLEEAASENLELKSLAKKLFLGFKSMGADVQLTTDKVSLDKAPTGNLDEKNVWIYSGNDAIEIHLVGEKAGGFFDKIQKDFPRFEFKDRGDSKSWNDQNIKNIAILPGSTT